MERAIGGLNFPTSIAMDPQGSVFIAESGLPFDGAPAGGVVSKALPDGSITRLADGLRPPVNGLAWHRGLLIVSEGGNPGRISSLDPETRERRTILDGLPGFGNYHTNMVAPGPGGKLYFSQGAMTNSGVIGLDSQDLAWLREVPHDCDTPGYDITLTGFEAETRDPRSPGAARVRTGAFSPFGTSAPGRRVHGRVPCTASVMRCDPDGSNLELVAWGLRNAYGLRFLPDGRLLATDQGADMRGSRPIANCADFLYEVRKGAWYGWPDFYGGLPGTAPSDFVLANHDELPTPERALVEFQPNCCAVKFTIIPDGLPHAGDLIVALFGDEKPTTAPEGPRVGRGLVRVSPRDWSTHAVQALPLKRPIDVAFCPRSKAAYVLDFGEFEIAPDKGVAARAGSGSLWKLPHGFPGV
jgi:glucose/arabinose dehydrogenase